MDSPVSVGSVGSAGFVSTANLEQAVSVLDFMDPATQCSDSGEALLSTGELCFPPPLKTETQKEQLMYKEKASKEAIRELNLAIQLFKEEEEKENEEVMKLREEIERVKAENEIQKEKLMQKDEEKMEVIRQLSMAMDLLREEKVAAIRGSSSRTKNRCGDDMQRQERLCSRLFG